MPSETAPLATALSTWLHRNAVAIPDRPALILGGVVMSWAVLRDRAEAQAAPATTPLIAGQSSDELTLLAYAAAVAGRAFFPVNPALPADPWHRLVGPGGGAELIVATSGTSGAAKAVMLSPGNLRAHVAASRARLRLAPDDQWLNCLPLFHVGGLMILWRCAEAGARVLLHNRFDVAAVADALPEVTHVSLVPTMLARLLDAGVAPGPRLRVCLVGGAALPGPLAERALAAGWPLCPTYGMSETASQVATLVPARPGWRPGLVGAPLQGLEVLLDGGRIRVRGGSVMLGYANPAMRPGDGLVDGWYETGDLGAWDEAGRLVVLGRADDVLISGGENIHPQAVEEVAARCPGVQAVGVTAQADALWGDRLVAVVVGTVSETDFLLWCRERLPPAQRPRHMQRAASLPLNATGKLDRKALRRSLAEQRFEPSPLGGPVVRPVDALDQPAGTVEQEGHR